MTATTHSRPATSARTPSPDGLPASPIQAPGPRSRFLVGNLPELASSTERLQTFLGWRREYGDVVRIHLGPHVEHVLMDPEHVKHVLHDHPENYPKSALYDKLRPVVGNGLLTSAGDFWLRQRRMMQPHFHPRGLAGLHATMVDATRSWVGSQLDRAAGGAQVDIAAEMMGLTLRIVGQTMLGVDLLGESKDLGRALTVALEESNRRMLSLVEAPRWVPTPANLRYRGAIATLDRIVLDIIRQRREHPGDHHDLLASLLSAKDEVTGEGMSDQQLRDEVMTIVLAGHETTANALTWTWYLLSKHPDVARKLRAEVDEVLGDRDPSAEDLGRLTYTGQVIQESMRILPPIPLIHRQALRDDVIGGFAIPAGSYIGIQLYALHRHPDWWENPEGFDPDRFSPERSAGRHRYAYLPFGGGQRVCIGNHFAMMEAKLIVAMVARAFELRLVPGHPVVPDFNTTLRPKHGVAVTLHARSAPGPADGMKIF